MRGQIAPEHIDKLTQQLASYLCDGADQTARNTAYNKLRRDAADGRINLEPLPLVVARLAVEYVIQATEKSLPSETAEPVSDIDAWSFLDPTSQHYVLGEETKTTVAFPHTPRKHAKQSRGLRALSRHVTTILSMWLHGLNRDASMDRIGYVWLVMDPLLQIMVICMIPLLIQPEYLYDMAIFPFAVIGACFWLTFRTAAIGAMSGGGVLKQQLEHPTIRRFDVILAKSVNAFVNYFVAGLALLYAAIFLDLTDGPQNFPMLILCYGTAWIMGISFGIIANSLIGLYPGLSRITVYSLRFIALMSGLFYAPEQLPQQVSQIVFYNPLLHVIQFARSFWFFEYTSMDASITYLGFWVLSLFFLALVCLYADETRLDKVRA